MNKPNFLINKYLNDCNGDCEQLCKELYKQGILSKQYNDEGVILIYNKFDDVQTSELKRECRSLVVDKATLKIKAYSCETPLCNIDKENIPNLAVMNMCYEGTLLSVFNHNDIWFASTRRCLNSNKSIFNQTELCTPKSHYQMFEEVLSKSGYSNFNNFCESLDKTKSYYFVLIHYENKHIIDYRFKFETEYTFICLVSIKDSDMVEQNLYDSNLPFINKYIFLPEKIESITEFININNQNKYDTSPSHEGIIVKVFSPETNKYTLYKLQTDSYKFAMVLGHSCNMYKGLIYLYQNNNLIDYFNQNPISSFLKIVNPLNTYESFITVSVIDSIFKVCTSEIFELFKNLWSLKTGKNQNTELYQILPKEYKDIMYSIRGLYYQKKAKLFENSTTEKSSDEFRKSHITINDIYIYLKKIHVDNIINFLKARKLMFNWVKFDKTNQLLIQFGKISSLCNSSHLKQCAIFTNKLHPDIIYSDFPSTKKE